MTAEFCDECDAELSEGSAYFKAFKIDKSEEFLHHVCLTLIRRVKNGYLKG